MSDEYEPGTEDIYLGVVTREDGLVSLGVYLVNTREKIYGVVLTPEVARSAAQQLTLASWRAEDGTNMGDTDES